MSWPIADDRITVRPFQAPPWPRRCCRSRVDRHREVADRNEGQQDSARRRQAVEAQHRDVCRGHDRPCGRAQRCDKCVPGTPVRPPWLPGERRRRSVNRGRCPRAAMVSTAVGCSALRLIIAQRSDSRGYERTLSISLLSPSQMREPGRRPLTSRPRATSSISAPAMQARPPASCSASFGRACSRQRPRRWSTRVGSPERTDTAARRSRRTRGQCGAPTG